MKKIFEKFKKNLSTEELQSLKDKIHTEIENHPLEDSIKSGLQKLIQDLKNDEEF